MNKNTGFTRVYKAAGYSLQGLRQVWVHEAAFRQESVLLLVGIVLACLFDISGIERILLIGSLVLVVIVEILNSAIEAIVDRVGTEHHELSGRAKDMGSAAVFIALCLAGFVWLVILWRFIPW